MGTLDQNIQSRGFAREAVTDLTYQFFVEKSLFSAAMEDLKDVYAVIVIGAGISGVATVKCLSDVGLKVLCLERSNSVGGLWTFKEKGYGVMSFTHM